jgi:HEAT repeat protein
VLLSILQAGGLQEPAWSQTTKKAGSPPADAPAPGPKPPVDAAPGAAAKPADQPAAAVEPPTPLVEIFRDPRAEKCLANTFPVLGKRARPGTVNQVKAMAANQAAVERATIEQFVQHSINELTDHSNIKAVIDPQAGISPYAAAQFAIQEATDNLIEILLSARAANNGNFVTTYNQVLLQMLPPVLENHLLSRIAAAIVLSQTGAPEAVDIFVKQLNNPEQTVWVSLWSARGLTNVQQLGRFNLDAARAIRAAKSVADFLEREKDLPWPVQYRALEALGSLRRANTPQMQRGQPEMAGTAAQFLTDPDGRIEVRVEAGWALGMMEIQAGINGYNFPMIAYSVGELAAMLGDRVRDNFPKNATQAEFWTGLIVAQVLQTFDGVDAARDSGLLKSAHPAATAARPFIKSVSDKTKPVAAAAVKLVREPAGRAAQNLKDLESRIAELKMLLQKNPPANTWLVPNGPKFPVGGAQVAKAPAGAARVVNAPAGIPPQ